MTYKILYNDAVAMTGGQHLDGPPGGQISVPMIASQLAAEGVKKIAVVTDEPDKYPANAGFPRDVTIHHRRDLQAVQIDLAKLDGVTVVIYDQTCAAEKRRRRKRNEFPNPDKRIFINPAVCEGCGDCGKKSNCVAVIPLETELGRKRAIDQSACNKDFSCTEGFCPSFVTVNGAKVRKSHGPAMGEGAGAATDGITAMLGSLPEPKQPDITGPYSMIVTGVGGTGVVTISAVLGQAAHIEGKGFGAIDMTGLAQKGGAVACHMRVAKDVASIHAIRVGVGNADLIMGGDLVVTASTKILETVRPDHTAMVVSTHEMTTGAFTRDPNLVVPGQKLRTAIADRVGKGPLFAFDAHDYAVTLFGDSIASNMFLLGYSYQKGFVPVGSAAIEQAIELNGAAIEMNRRAFRFGRLAAHDAAALDRIAKPVAKAAPKPKTLADTVAFRADHLTKYQDAALAARYQAQVKRIADLEAAKTPGRSGLAEAVARSYHKLLAIKDEYEVARLYTDPSFKAALDAQFEGVGKLEFHVAPPFLAPFHKDKVTGHPRKIKVGAWMLPVFRLLVKAKGLRGSKLDVFGMSAERKLERQMITDYEALLTEVAEKLTAGNHATAVALASLPEDVKGFGHVKAENYATAKKREADLLKRLRTPSPTPVRQAAE